MWPQICVWHISNNKRIEMKNGALTRSHGLGLGVLVAALLAACGGGGGDESPSSGPTSPAASSPAAPAPGLKVQGSAQTVAAVSGKVNVILSAPAWSSDGSIASGTYFMGAPFDVVGLKEAAPGAYSEFVTGTNVATLSSSATIAEVAGNGQFAIGRWTDGSDTLGGTYNVNQGRTYAVGTPVTVNLAVGTALNCSLVASTKPTSGAGNASPGTLEIATAKVAMSSMGSLVYNLNLTYSIGSDLHQAFSATGVYANSGVFSSSTKSTLVSRLVGADPAKPSLMLSYGVQSASTGTVNGVAVLGCS
ncbi:hypothetical protein [Cupriavidus sp. TMH.W2]|uniref:hypothetical protein n=1 Tax=Cupriavidus sp. TMH.W2 TaxID=3434465 RepID=UPI003D780B3A